MMKMLKLYPRLPKLLNINKENLNAFGLID